MSGERLDLSSDVPLSESSKSPPTERKFLGIHFGCCDVYARVYINRDETAYRGNCPRCGKRLDIRVGPGGTDTRFFSVY